MTAQSFTEGFGYRLGRGAKRIVQGDMRCEQHAVGWLVAQGIATPVAIVLLWTFKFAAIGALFFVAFWLAVLFLGVVAAAAWVEEFASTEFMSIEPEWRNGPAGYGLYTYDDHRIDPHVFDDDN